MFKLVTQQCVLLTQEFDLIPEARKEILNRLAAYIIVNSEQQKPIQLMYVCTHNSRRSHFGQLWAHVAADYFGISNVTTYSGGTEATAFNPNAIQALQEVGFEITAVDSTLPNPHYMVRFGEGKQTTCFSKVFDHAVNPTTDFAAIMTCSDAEANCPFIPGVALRLATTYDDPKAFDGTPLQAEKYLERSTQIGRECLYVFSQVKSHLNQSQNHDSK